MILHSSEVPRTSSDLVEVRDLCKHFPLAGGWFEPKLYVRAVDGVSLTLRRGEVFGLAGESGCGKSTLGRCILRLVEPTSGEVRFEGRNLASLPPHELRRMRRQMQIIFQDPFASLNPRMRVGEILREPFAIRGETEGMEEKTTELVEAVGLPRDSLGRYPHEFSGGQRQRIAVARALALKPRFVVADEPVAALDVSVQAQILNLLLDLQQQFGMTYLLTSHSVPVLRHVAQRIGVMYLGKLVEVGPAEEVVTAPLHPYTQNLIRSVPVLPNEVASPEEKGNGQATSSMSIAELPSPTSPPAGCRYHPRCPLAVEQCRVEEPVLREVKSGHFASCHLAESAS